MKTITIKHDIFDNEAHPDLMGKPLCHAECSMAAAWDGYCAAEWNKGHESKYPNPVREPDPKKCPGPGTYTLIPDTHVAVSKGAVRQLRAFLGGFQGGYDSRADREVTRLLAKLPEVGE